MPVHCPKGNQHGKKKGTKKPAVMCSETESPISAPAAKTARSSPAGLARVSTPGSRGSFWRDLRATDTGLVLPTLEEWKAARATGFDPDG